MAGQRRAIVGVIGGDKQMSPAVALGKLIAEHEWILLTGGQVLPRRTVERKGEVKDASMLGAAEAAPSTARLIGILPGKQPGESVYWERASGGRRLFLHSGQPHYVRNIINGQTPDVLVAFGGSSGTLAEIAFAKASDRPLLFFPGSLERLRRNFREKLHQGPNVSENLRTYFELPLEAYPEAARVANDVSQLISMLKEVLFGGKEVDELAPELSFICGNELRNDETGFPGLPGDNSSKATFEAIVQEVSR
jgi:SLOG cluster4 family